MNYKLAGLTAVGCASLIAVAAIAGSDAAPDTLAAALAVEISDVVAGGNWTEGAQTGTYRAVVVQTGGEKDAAAHVFVQWLSLKEGGSGGEIVKSVPLKEFNDQKLPNASITLESDIDSEARIVVAGQDGVTHKDAVFTIKATKPGIYVVAPPPAARPGAGSHIPEAAAADPAPAPAK